MTKHLLAALGALALVAAGCKKESEPAPQAKTEAPAQKTAPAAATATAAAPSGPTGTIEGVVVFQGTPPKGEPVMANTDPACTNVPKTDQSVVVHDGKLANVLVHVTDPGLKVAAPTQPVVVDQKGCWYQPHVQGAVAGQPLEVRNGDQTLHNVHAYEGMRALFNNAQPPGTPAINRPLPTQQGVVKLKCDVHPWMQAFVVVGNNPYFATTSPIGQFRIANVPAGHHTLEAWQEKLGVRTVDVEVKPNQITHVSFAYGTASAKK